MNNAPVNPNTVVGIYAQSGLTEAGSGPCYYEFNNLYSIVLHFIKTDAQFSAFQTDISIESFGDPDLAAKLDALTFFFMTDMEVALVGWNTTSQSILRDYVSNGGNFVMVSALCYDFTLILNVYQLKLTFLTDGHKW